MLDPRFSKIENILRNQKYTYEEVFLKEQAFDTPQFHYDWWLFPIQLPGNFTPSRKALHFSINDSETLELLQDEDFKQRYLHCIELYLDAQKESWNGYPIRFTKMMFSMEHFIRHSLNMPELMAFNERLLELAELGLELNAQYDMENHPDANAMYNKEYNAINKMEDLLKEINKKSRFKI